jgi:hypothetical protein
MSKKQPPLADTDPVLLLSSLVLEDGRTWGEVAHGFQWQDARAFLTPPEPASARRHYVLRGRGMSKTTDWAAIALVLLLTEAPARSRSFVYAVDEDQARIFLDSLGGLVERSGLTALVDVGPLSVTVRQTAATLTVESSSGASAFGKRPWLVIADELAMWPDSTNHLKLWSAIVSALAKVPGSRLAVTTTAGDPGGLGERVWNAAHADEAQHWRTAKHPGPAPWWTSDDIAATAADLTPAEWQRLILCEWAAGDTALISPEEVAACIRTDSGSLVLPPKPGVEYLACLDIGTRNDYTALIVGHRERTPFGVLAVVDLARVWKPEESPGGRVSLAEVEAAVRRHCAEYRVRWLLFDRHQAEQMRQNLAKADAGKPAVPVKEFVFSASSTTSIARNLHNAFRDRLVQLPDHPEIRAESRTVQIVETGSGHKKLYNPPRTHDDLFTVVGMLLAHFEDSPLHDTASVSVPGAKRADGSSTAPIRHTLNPTGARPVASPAARIRAVEQRQKAKLPGGALVVPGSANDARARDDGRRSWERL